eukprot:6464592-Amphidinium_carterae.1
MEGSESKKGRSQEDPHSLSRLSGDEDEHSEKAIATNFWQCAIIFFIHFVTHAAETRLKIDEPEKGHHGNRTKRNFSQKTPQNGHKMLYAGGKLKNGIG